MSPQNSSESWLTLALPPEYCLTHRSFWIYKSSLPLPTEGWQDSTCTDQPTFFASQIRNTNGGYCSWLHGTSVARGSRKGQPGCGNWPCNLFSIVQDEYCRRSITIFCTLCSAAFQVCYRNEEDIWPCPIDLEDILSPLFWPCQCAHR